MIITRVASGLGNQMFMYAAGVVVASRLNTQLFIDTSHFKAYPVKNRYYQLSCFPEITERKASFFTFCRLSPHLAFTKLIFSRPVKRWHIFRRLIRKINSRFPNDAVYSPKYASYAPEFETIHDNLCIEGCFESEKCLAGSEDLVRRKFTFSPECFNPALLAEVQSCESVAVHVRRGDKAEENVKFYGTSERYLREALEKITSLTRNARFFVFSDDIDWCRKNLAGIYESNYTFIEGQTPAQDMALMTKCRHVIMGPSTFSWWGAWLNDNPRKIIITPDLNLWYKEGMYNPEDRKYLLPPEWIKIS